MPGAITPQQSVRGCTKTTKGVGGGALTAGPEAVGRSAARLRQQELDGAIPLADDLRRGDGRAAGVRQVQRGVCQAAAHGHHRAAWNGGLAVPEDHRRRVCCCCGCYSGGHEEQLAQVCHVRSGAAAWTLCAWPRHRHSCSRCQRNSLASIQ